MTLTISEAARSKRVTRNAIWLAINREELSARKTSGGMWLIEEDHKWRDYSPRRNKPRSSGSARRSEERGE